MTESSDKTEREADMSAFFGKPVSYRGLKASDGWCEICKRTMTRKERLTSPRCLGCLNLAYVHSQNESAEGKYELMTIDAKLKEAKEKLARTEAELACTKNRAAQLESYICNIGHQRHLLTFNEIVKSNLHPFDMNAGELDEYTRSLTRAYACGNLKATKPEVDEI